MIKDGQLSSKKILVTGASGFVGLRLLERLVEDGKVITALHNQTLSSDVCQNFGDSITWNQIDITSDSLEKCMKDIDVVFHLAAYSTISESEEDKKKLEQVNVTGTRRVAEAAKTNGVQHFIFVSSIAAGEKSDQADVDEENGYPVSTYGKTKLAAEVLLQDMMASDFNMTILRPTALFGEDHLGSVFELTKAIQSGRFFIIGGGSNRTNFYYIRDFIVVLMSVMGDSRSFGKVFIAADKPCTLSKLTNIIVNELELKRNISKIPIFLGFAIGVFFDLISMLTKMNMPLSKRRVRAMTSDIAYSNLKLESDLGVMPKFGVTEGLRRTIAWYRKSGHL